MRPPHPRKRSATIEAIDDRENVLAQGRFGTDRDRYRAMLALVRQLNDRVWAVDGCNGIGRHIAETDQSREQQNLPPLYGALAVPRAPAGATTCSAYEPTTPCHATR